MWKRLVVFLVVALFVFGASGGCLNMEPPDLSGTWKGTLSRSINPTVPDFAEVTMTINPNNSGGSATVEYKIPGTDEKVTLPQMEIYGIENNAIMAIIKARGTNDTGSDIVIDCGNNVSFKIPSGELFYFDFEIFHGYACRGGELDELVGTYRLVLSTDNPLDSGGVTLVKQ